MRTIITLAIIALMLVCCKPRMVQGDLNRDGSVTQNDFSLCLDIATAKVLPTPYQMTVGDVNHDGRINSADCALISRMIQ